MKNKFRGLTLVELIVAFAILSILMATIASLLPGFVKQYSYVQNSVQADKIGTTILDIVESELSYSTKIVDYSEKIEGNTIVEYVNKDLISIKLCIVDESRSVFDGYNIENFGSELNRGELALIYDKFDYRNKEGNVVTSEPVAWGYTSNFYVKNVIENFEISKAGSEYRDNIFRISFDLVRKDTNQSKTFTRLIECVNSK